MSAEIMKYIVVVYGQDQSEPPVIQLRNVVQPIQPAPYPCIIIFQGLVEYCPGFSKRFLLLRSLIRR